MGKLKFYLLVGMAAPSLTNAATISTEAALELVEPLAISQTVELDFGRVGIPGTGNNEVRVNPDGEYSSSTDGAIGSFQTNAVFEVVGQPNATVEYDQVLVDSSIPGVTFDRLFHATSQTIPADGTDEINVGGRIYVDSTAIAGNYNNGELTYTLQAEYQ